LLLLLLLLFALELFDPRDDSSLHTIPNDAIL
jgi:hypothetical protein